jgi:predicted nucleic acid-binding protein
MVFIDTSVIIAYYCPETLSDKIEDYLKNLSTPVISNLTELEFGSAISKKIRTKEISLSDAEKLQAFFQMHLNDDYYIKIPIQ